MRGLDYRWLEALDEIIAQRSFEKAASVLCVSQSAVSQRIKQLEKWLAQPVLIRENPPSVTSAGQKLLGLYRQVCALEQDILPELSNDDSDKPVSVSIATNADSLATWLLPAITSVMQQRNLEIHFVVDDERRTLDKLKKGEVIGAISQSDKSLPGCHSTLLGDMPYLCVSTPEFFQQYFSKGVNSESFQRAPAVSFDRHDFVNERFVFDNFGYEMTSHVKHTVASSEACVKAALAGFGYCMIPRVQIENELSAGKLVDICPGLYIDQQLYWHHWQLETGILKKISRAIVQYAGEVLR